MAWFLFSLARKSTVAALVRVIDIQFEEVVVCDLKCWFEVHSLSGWVSIYLWIGKS